MNTMGYGWKPVLLCGLDNWMAKKLVQWGNRRLLHPLDIQTSCPLKTNESPLKIMVGSDVFPTVSSPLKKETFVSFRRCWRHVSPRKYLEPHNIQKKAPFVQDNFLDVSGAFFAQLQSLMQFLWANYNDQTGPKRSPGKMVVKSKGILPRNPRKIIQVIRNYLELWIQPFWNECLVISNHFSMVMIWFIIQLIANHQLNWLFGVPGIC